MNTIKIGKSDINTPFMAMGTWAIGGGTAWVRMMTNCLYVPLMKLLIVA